MRERWREVSRRMGEASGVTMWIAEGDIAALDTEAVTNAANDHGWMGSGVAGALKRAGGSGIETEAMATAPKRPGTAWATGAGDLPAGHVIHAAAMGQDLRTDTGLVEAATAAAVEVARELGVTSVALPALGTGVGGLAMAEAAASMVHAVVRELRAGPGDIADVVFSVYGTEAADAFGDALAGVVEAS